MIIWNRHGHECSRIWKLSANFTLIQCIKIVSRFFGPRYIGDDFFFRAEIYRGRLFLGPNLVSFNRTLVISWSRRRHIVRVSPRIQEVVLVNERFLGHQYIFFFSIFRTYRSPSRCQWNFCLEILQNKVSGNTMHVCKWFLSNFSAPLI